VFDSRKAVGQKAALQGGSIYANCESLKAVPRDRFEFLSQRFGLNDPQDMVSGRMGSRRPKEAWRQTRTDWKPELLYGVVAGAVSVIGLTVAGWPESGAASVLIPLGSVLGGALIVPLGQFVWRILWQPWHDLRSEVTDIKRQLANQRQAGQEGSIHGPVDNQGVANRLLILRDLENELRANVAACKRAVENRHGSSLTKQTLAWRKRGGPLSSADDLQEAYEVIRDTYEAIDEIRVPEGQLDDEEVAEVKEMILKLETGLYTIERAIGKYC
jgi:hypothetical protein